VRIDDDDDRRAQIDMFLEQLRIHTEDLTELAKEAADRAHDTTKALLQPSAKTRAIRGGKKR
jgi:hypothetical protein